MSCHRTGVWSPRGSCSALRWRCPYRCGRSRRCSPRTFLQRHRAQGPQGNHSDTKKHHGTQGTVPTHCFSSIQPRTHKQLLNTHVGNILASATSRLFVGTLQTKILPSGYSICVKHKSLLLGDESVTASQYPHAHSGFWLIPWHFPPMRHLVTLSTTKWVFLNPSQLIFPTARAPSHGGEHPHEHSLSLGAQGPFQPKFVPLTN